MNIQELKLRREQIIAAMNQNAFTMQGHLQEVDFQISELEKLETPPPSPPVDEPPVNPEEPPV